MFGVFKFSNIKNYLASMRLFYFTPSAPEQLHIELNDSCNLSCVFCPRHLVSNKTTMPLPLVNKILSEAAAAKVKQVRFFVMGEPLLYPYLFEAINYAKKLGLNAQFNTNGMLLDEATSRKIVESGLDEVTISLDGTTKEAYEAVRKGGNYDLVYSNVMNLLQTKNTLKSATPAVVVQSINAFNNDQEVNEFVKFWSSKSVAVSITGLSGLTDYAKKYENLPKPKSCTQPFYKLIVSANGNYYPCCEYPFELDGELLLGNANEGSLLDAFNSDKMQKIRRLHRSQLGRKLKSCSRCGQIA